MSPSHTVGLELHCSRRGVWLALLPSPSHTVGLERDPSAKKFYPIYVAIPHGGLRTSFLKVSLNQSVSSSPSHTVGLEPQITTLAKIRHINHFVKRAPFSNEVNFPKSEVMQS